MYAMIVGCKCYFWRAKSTAMNKKSLVNLFTSLYGWSERTAWRKMKQALLKHGVWGEAGHDYTMEQLEAIYSEWGNPSEILDERKRMVRPGRPKYSDRVG